MEAQHRVIVYILKKFERFLMQLVIASKERKRGHMATEVCSLLIAYYFVYEVDTFGSNLDTRLCK